jgi:hypothetical protein
MGSSTSHYDLVLEETATEDWSEEYVQRWLKYKMLDKLKNTFKKNNINGKKLLELNEKSLKEMSSQLDETLINKFMKELEQLKKRKPSNSTAMNGENAKEVHNVLTKLENLRGLSALGDQQKLERAKNLALKNNLLETYLNQNFVATKEILSSLIESDENSSALTSNTRNLTKLIPTTSRYNATTNNNNNSGGGGVGVGGITGGFATSKSEAPVQEIRVYDEDKTNLKQMKQDVAEYESILNVRDEEFLRIKLVIVEIHQNATQRTFRKILSPIMDAFDMSPTFGLFHSALIVGPWYLEWNDSSLIVPRKCYSGAAILAADVSKEFKGGKEVKDALDKMADVICRWNGNYQYSQNTKNCQTFVDELCKELGIDLNFTGALGEYLVQLRKNGQCELKYFIPDELKQLMGIEDKYKKFSTHQELDDFVRAVLEKDTTYFDVVAPDDWTLLKSFDRAFWLRYFKDKTAPTWRPRSVDDDGATYQTTCPFGHPHATHSMAENIYTFVEKKKKKKTK